MEPSILSPKHEQNPSSSSLFPLFPLSSSTPEVNPNFSNNDPQWLSNPSFTPTLSSVTAALPIQSSSSDEDDQPPPLPPSYDLVGSTDSEGSKRKEERRRKKKKKRKREPSRRSEDRGWAGSAVTKPAKDYYFDVRGDRDNLVYGSLYRMDVARYKIQNQSELPGSFQLFRWRPSNSSMDVDCDLDLLDKKLRTGGRYCSVKYTTLERHKDLKHVKIVNKKMSSIVPGEYIPILEWFPDNGSNLPAAKEDIEESWEDEVVRRTRELNKMSRDFPHDEKVWLAFAEFQDKIASTQRQKAARLQTLEKKISILEKAVDLNPDNEELLLFLLKSCQERDSSAVLMEKWEKVLMQHSDNVTLWREFLLVCQGEFSQFKVSDMRRTYAHAIQALSSACDKLCRFKSAIDKARALTIFIYAHHSTLSMMRKLTKKRGIVRPGVTRFASNYLTLQSLVEKKEQLRIMFASEEWTRNSHSKSVKGKVAYAIVVSISFWKSVNSCLIVFRPLVRVLRLVDSDRPSMLWLYGELEVAKREIKEDVYSGVEKNYKPIIDIIETRSKGRLDSDLHLAGYMLNPYYFAKNKVEIGEDLACMEAIINCVEKFFSDDMNIQVQISDEELLMYKNLVGMFGRKQAELSYQTKGVNDFNPAGWWSNYGGNAPNLKKMAIRILSLTTSSSGCERNWSTFEGGRSTDPSLVQQELGVVDIFISLCRFEWQTGYQELATGLFQAEIEYCLFCPSLLLSSQSKRRLFEHFWNAGGARIGEDGALGWSAWLENVEQKNMHNTSEEEFLQETEVGGWTGWSEPPSKKIALGKHPEILENALDNGNTEENLDSEDLQPNDDIESLLKKLGVNVDAEPHSEIKDAKTWNRWAEEELSRDSEQWRPVREHSGNSGTSWFPLEEDNQDVEGNEQLSRVILFEDVSDFLFNLCSEEARFSLVSQFIDFYGGKVSRWACTNNPSWTEKLQSLETVPDSFSEDLRVVFEMANTTLSSPVNPNLKLLLGGIDKFSRNTNVMKFLRNAILLLLNVFPRNHILEEALLAAEESFLTKMDSSTCAVNPSRALAKSLLKNDRQDLLLCGVYARSEANYRNVDIARKIFDMALSSTDGLPPDLKEYVPLLYFWYAEMEMEICRSKNSSESEQRAIHILSCLGGNLKYSPFKCQPSGFQILKAHQGFKEKIEGLRSSRGDIKEYSVALICAASLFEALSSGLAASIEVVEGVFSMALPERRNMSLQLESLWFYYIGMLQKHIKQWSFSRVFVKFEHGLQLYPYNPKSFISMVEVSSLYAVPHKVRRLFDEYIRRKPSVVVWLVALSFELSKPGAQHRIHGLFEKALANNRLRKSVLLWRLYLAYEADLAHNPSAARRIFFRAIHACPWSKRLWLDGFQKLSSILTASELSDLQEVMRDKELNLRTDIYEILLQDGTES